VGFTPEEGMQCELYNLHRGGKEGMAIMWDVKGVTNRGYKAHFTVYYGPNAAAQKLDNFR
jgi:hypothetical protein